MDEEDQQETQFCSNCKKDIPAKNFMMHVPHCQRNIILCRLCEEPIPKSQEEQHYEEYHEKVKCECGESMEKMHLEEHKENECKSRKTVCEYCELELTFQEIDNHKEYCGSRTELCEKCNKRIRHRDLEEHMLSDCSLDKNKAVTGNSASTDTSSRVQSGLGWRHPAFMVHNFGVDGNIDSDGLGSGPEVHHPLIAPGFVRLPVRDIFEPDDVMDTRNVLPFNMFPKGNVSRGIFSTHRNLRKPERDQIDPLVDNQEVDSDGDTSHRQNLEKDELMAALLASDNDGDFDEQNYNGLKELLPVMNPHDNCNLNMNFDNRNEDLDETVLPCEFCGKAIKAQDLIQHQTGCQLMSSNPLSLMYPQLRSQPHSLPPLDTNLNDNEEHYNDKEHHDETFLPCEFCQELFPSDSLIGHQSICDPQGSRPTSVIQNIQGTFFEPKGQYPNNSPPRTRNRRPPRPSRPVVVGEYSDEEHTHFFDEESNLRPTMATSNGSISSSEQNSHSCRQFEDFSRERYSNSNDNNNRHVSDLPSEKSRTRRNNVDSRQRDVASNSVQLTVCNKQVSKAANKYKDNRKVMSTAGYHHPLSRASRVSDEGEKERCVVALPRRSHLDGQKGLQETRELSPDNDQTCSAFSGSERHRNGPRNERTTEVPLDMRPLQESGATSTYQRLPKMGLSPGTLPFKNTTTTRKEVRRLAPSFDQPQSSTENKRKDRSKISSQRRDYEQRTTEAGTHRTSGRANQAQKNKVSRKKIV